MATTPSAPVWPVVVSVARTSTDAPAIPVPLAASTTDTLSVPADFMRKMIGSLSAVSRAVTGPAEPFGVEATTS